MAFHRHPERFLSPGVYFLIRILAGNILPIFGVTYLSIVVLQSILSVTLPLFVVWGVVLTSVPLFYTTVVVFFEFRKRQRAKALGAALPPTWDGKLIGNYDILKLNLESIANGYLAEQFWPVRERLGNLFNMRILWADAYITVEPEHIKQILATEFKNFEKGMVFKQTMDSVLGTGVFNADGEMWKFHRAMTRPFFSRDRISDFELFTRHADAVIARMAERFREGVAVDFQDAVARFTLDSATEFLFGACVNSVEAGLPYPENHRLYNTSALAKDISLPERFARAFADAQWDIARRIQFGGVWPLTEITGDKTRGSMEIVNAYLNPILAEAVRRKRAYLAERKIQSDLSGYRREELKEEETLLDSLVKQTDDPVVLKDEILNILIAGRDTTASTLTFAVYLLSQHPDVLRRLRLEILETIGADRAPTLEDIRKMKYLRAVINETLRLYPAVPFNVRTAIDETTLLPTTPGGKPIYVPPGTQVTYSVFIMHRRTDLWGPDAMEFDPDRFIDDRLHKYLTPNPFIFVPFNAGPRICLGQQFAYNEASFMLARLLQTFDSITLDKSAQPAEGIAPLSWRQAKGRQAKEELFPKSHLTIYMRKGLWIRLGESVGTDVTV